MTKSMVSLSCVIFYILLAGCSVHYRNGAPEQGSSGIEVRKSVMVSFKMVKTADNTVIGYLEETESIVTSPNSPDGQESIRIFYVYDKDFNKVGFMTGQVSVSVYRYTAEGAVAKVSTGTIYTIETGNRRLLSYDGAIYYEDFEPAPFWRNKQ